MSEITFGQMFPSNFEKSEIRIKKLKAKVIFEHRPSILSNKNGRQISYVDYDSTGAILNRINYGLTSSGDKYEIKMNYDYKNNSISEKKVLGKDSLLFDFYYHFNNKGQMIESILKEDDIYEWKKITYDSNDYESTEIEYIFKKATSDSIEDYSINIPIYERDTFEIFSVATNRYECNGNLIETLADNRAGFGSERFTYIYDSNNKLIEDRRYISSNEYWSHKYQYNSDRNLTEDVFYNYKGLVNSILTYVYDLNGNCSERRLLQIGDDKYQGWKVKMKFNDNNMKIEEVQYNVYGSFVEKIKYSYNEKGDLIKESHFDIQENPIVEYKFIYQYFK
ncbi:MAG: hypothetical protein J7604_16895 [Sporocytophaga sp.]|uniref:hypothetical protein n=1 Tax=Sporocytophaga sp. TaxID=2231183 RepID=UPI001AFFB6F0|nr:hypothetical protein [Sporocytophaga sp.]MBO9701888.1 hypothetical protein [Sporocytophaga sp.]